MNKNSEKKLPQFSHRRVKTDLSFRMGQKTLDLPIQLKRSPSNRRYQTESRESKVFRSSTMPKFAMQQVKTVTKGQQLKTTYNKWFIKPDVRMKKSLIRETKPDEIDLQFAYNKLYEETTFRSDFPFLTIKNEKLQILQKIPVHNLRLLEGFKKNQQLKKKRVPKIIQLFLRSKSSVGEN